MPSSSLRTQLRRRDTQRLADYRKHLAFYEGRQWDTVRRPGVLTVNYTRAIIKKATSFLMTGFQLSVDPISPAAEDAAREAERALADNADANSLTRVDFATEVDCAVLGDAAYKITWSQLDGAVRVTAVDVAGIFPDPVPGDLTRFRRVCHLYTATDQEIAEAFGVDAGRPQTEVIEEWTSEILNVYVGDTATPAVTMPNPYRTPEGDGIIPFVVYPNEAVPKQWNGESDVAAMLQVQRELNYEHTRLANIMELSGFPITVLAGVDKAEGILAQAGAIWELPPEAKADVLDLLKHGATDQHLAYLDAVKRTMHDLSETPRAAFGDNQRDLSGVALEVELLPLLHKVARKRAIRADAYAQRAAIILALTDQFTATTHLAAGTPVVNWQSPTPRDRTREIQNERLLTDGALSSRRTAMERLGEADPDTELAAINQERRELGVILDQPETAKQQVDTPREPA